MDYQQPAIYTREKRRTHHGEVRDNWALVVDNADRATSTSSAASPREPLAHPVPDDAESYNLAENLREPFDQPVAVTFHDTPTSPLTALVQERPKPLDPHSSTCFETNNLADLTANTKPQPRHQFVESSVYRSSRSSMSMFSYEESPTTPRYYSTALSTEDKQALVQGELNHNLQEWSGKSLVTHHDARKDLVPRVMPKVEKTNTLAEIEHDRQHSQRALSRITDKDEEYARAQLRQASQSTYDLRASMLSPPELPPLPRATPTPPIEEGEEPRYYHSSHARAASSGDYFSQPPGPRRSAYNTRRISTLAYASGSPSSSSSTRVRSPLNQEVRFRANPEMTFDSFLAPHKSGKGEVFHDSQNAMKATTPKGSPGSSPKTTGKMMRLTKIPSMPLLRKRSNGS